MDDEYNLQDHSDLYILDLGKWRSKYIIICTLIIPVN